MYIQFDKVIISRVWDLTWFRSRHEYKINMAHTITTKYCTWYDFLLTKITAHFIANRDLSCCLYIYIYIGFAEELNLSFSKKIMHTQYIFGLKICIIRIKHMHYFLLKTTNFLIRSTMRSQFRGKKGNFIYQFQTREHRKTFGAIGELVVSHSILRSYNVLFLVDISLRRGHNEICSTTERSSNPPSIWQTGCRNPHTGKTCPFHTVRYSHS